MDGSKENPYDMPIEAFWITQEKTKSRFEGSITFYFMKGPEEPTFNQKGDNYYNPAKHYLNVIEKAFSGDTYCSVSKYKFLEEGN